MPFNAIKTIFHDAPNKIAANQTKHKRTTTRTVQIKRKHQTLMMTKTTQRNTKHFIVNDCVQDARNKEPKSKERPSLHFDL